MGAKETQKYKSIWWLLEGRVISNKKEALN